MPRTSSSANRSAAKKQLVLYRKPLSERKNSSRRKSHPRKSGSRSKGISEDAMAILLLTRTEQEGKDVDNILPFLLLSGNSLKHSMLPIVILHLQNSKISKSNLLPYLLAFSHGQLGEDQLLPMLLLLRDGNGGIGNGFGSRIGNYMGMSGYFGEPGRIIGTAGLMFGQDEAAAATPAATVQQNPPGLQERNKRRVLNELIQTRPVQNFRAIAGYY